MRTLAKLTLGLAAPCMAGWPLVASAQEQAADDTYELIPLPEPSAKPAAAATAAAVRAPGLEEIVVTAQRRSENIRSVPIAITVLSGDALRDAGISNFDDMARHVPNVSFNTDFNSLYLRGIGTAELNVIGEQAVAYLLDDVYVPRLDFLKVGMLDVSSIEVLKGPQGTLYGRNATGGVLKIGYGDPEPYWSGYVDASLGERNRQSFEGALTGPITDWLAFRIAAKEYREDGYVYDANLDRDIADRHQQQIRLKLQAELRDDLTGKIGYEFLDYFVGHWGGSEISIYPDSLRQGFGNADQNFDSEINRRGSSTVQNNSDGRGFIAPITLEWRPGDFTLTSLTAFAGLDDIQGGDAEGLAGEFARIYADQDFRQFSQELRLVSPPGRFSYVAGSYFLKTDLHAVTSLPITGDLIQALGTNPLGAALDDAGILPVLDDVVPPPSNGVEDSPTSSLLEVVDDLNVKALGFFGQVNFDATDTLTLIAGARYSVDKKVGHVVLADRGPAPIWTPFILGGYDAREKFTDRDFAPKFSLTWEAHPDATIYATYAKGSRGGSFNIAAFTEDELTFDAETSATYEAGIKTSLLQGLIRFNLGAYYTEYNDYQLAALNGFTYVIENAPEALSQGIETDITALLAEGLIVSATYGFNDAEFVDHPNGGCITQSPDEPGYQPSGIGALPPKPTCDLSGQPLFRAPRHTGSLQINYEFGVGDRPWKLFLGADASYKGGEFQDSDLDPDDFQEAYWLYNARLGIKHETDGWRIELHGKNLSDELVRTFSGDIPFQPGAHWVLTNPPRTYHLSLRYNFEL